MLMETIDKTRSDSQAHIDLNEELFKNKYLFFLNQKTFLRILKCHTVLFLEP